MKKLLLMLLILFWVNVMSQTTLFEDSFESYDDFAIANVGNWTLTDVDQQPTYSILGVAFLNSYSAKSFQVFNSTTTSPVLTPSSSSDWTAKTGDKNMVCFAATKPSSAPLNNDWLISPQITLGASGNTLSFWAKSCDALYGLERFKVGISTTNTSTSSFTMISSPPYVVTSNDVTWNEYSYNLDNYANSSVYIAINCVSNDQFGFAVDDFKVTTSSLSTDAFFKNHFSVYPNPTKGILNIISSSVAIDEVNLTDVNGRSIEKVSLNGGLKTQLDLNDINSGIYFLKVTSDQGVGTSKIIKN